MDFHRHPPMLTPLISAAALMAMGGFLLHRMHPGGIRAVLRGEKPKAAKTVTFVPAVVSDPNPVAWGEPGLLQIGLQAPLRHDLVGPVWMGLRMRHNASATLGLAAGMKGTQGGGRVVVKVAAGSGQTAEWPIPESDLAFNLRIPKGEEITLPFRLDAPAGAVDVARTNTLTVSVAIRGVAIVTEQGVAGPVDLESGGIVLTKCWSFDGARRPKGRDPGDDGLGIRPGDIVIPVPGQK